MVSVRSLGLSGISGYEVTVECFLSGGLPAFDVVGLPDTAVREARERVRAAVKTCGARFPVSRITVNLAPANHRKEGTVYDLPILLGLLTASEELPPLPEDAAFLGELSLTGALRPVAGVLPMALCAARCGIRKLYVPARNAAEATLAEGSVALQHPGGRNLICLHPGQQAVYDAEAELLEVNEVPVGDLLLIRYGVITLDNATLPEIIGRIEQAYGVELRPEGQQMPDDHYNFNFQKDASVEDVVDLLQFVSGCRFKIIQLNR